MGNTEYEQNAFFIRTLSFLFMPGHSTIECFLNLGIYPVNSDLYPKNRLDARLLEKYVWKLSGEPLDWDKLASGLVF